MKRLIFLVFSFFLFCLASAQKNADIGIWGGLGTYSGDMTYVDYRNSVHPTVGAFWRYNYNLRLSMRGSLMVGKNGAIGEFESSTWEFKQNVMDFSLMGEFNFFKYYLGDHDYPATTYLMAGVGFSFYTYEHDSLAISNVTTAPEPVSSDYYYSKPVAGIHIPFGIGFKFNVGKRMGLGIEAQARRYFDDRFDNLDDPRKFEAIDDTGNPYWTTYTDNVHNNDWTFHLGVYLSYRFYQKGNDCAVYE